MSVNRLQELTDKIVAEGAISLSQVPSVKENGFVEYELDKGSALAWRILDKKEITVADSFLTAGTIFPYHKHPISTEILVVYKGVVSVISECFEERQVLRAGDYTIIDCASGHALMVKEDAWIVAITVPSDSEMFDHE